MTAIQVSKREEDKFIGVPGFSQTAIQLFEALEKEDGRVKDFLINDFRGLPVSPEIEALAYDYFMGHSVITAATVANRGSSVTTEFLYDGLYPPSPIDSYFLQSKAGKAVKARLIAIERELPNLIRRYQTKSDVLIGNLGSGPGRDVIDTLAHHRDFSNVRAIHLDKDKKALERGKRMAISKGVAHLIEFIEGDFLKYRTPEKFDIVLLIGILCPLDIKTCTTVLKVVKRLLKKGGCLIASNATKKMKKGDPFTCYIMEWTAGWKLVFKDEEELKQIYKEAGYTWQRQFVDSYGFHMMGIGTLPSA